MTFLQVFLNLVRQMCRVKVTGSPIEDPPDLKKENYRTEDGGNLWITALQCFADDMTCVIEETEKNLLAMKTIFEEFAMLSGLEINEKKTKVIRIGTKLDDVKPITNKVKFVYTKVFKLLGVDLDNKF